MVNMSEDFEHRHNEYYRATRHAQNSNRISAPGMQYLVHLLRGGYLDRGLQEGNGRKMLDVGCGSGFNSVTFAMMGWEVEACEINQEIVEHARRTIKAYGFDIHVKIGENENLPYEDGSFDFLLSMNVIHYVQGEEAVKKTIDEYARVLKKGGRILLSTNHPDNWILQGAEHVRKNVIKVNLPGDYRDGQNLFLFSSEEMLARYFSSHFGEIMTGENRFDFFTKQVRNLLLTGIKP